MKVEGVKSIPDSGTFKSPSCLRPNKEINRNQDVEELCGDLSDCCRYESREFTQDRNESFRDFAVCRTQHSMSLVICLHVQYRNWSRFLDGRATFVKVSSNDRVSQVNRTVTDQAACSASSYVNTVAVQCEVVVSILTMVWQSHKVWK